MKYYHYIIKKGKAKYNVTYYLNVLDVLKDKYNTLHRLLTGSLAFGQNALYDI